MCGESEQRWKSLDVARASRQVPLVDECTAGSSFSAGCGGKGQGQERK